MDRDGSAVGCDGLVAKVELLTQRLPRNDIGGSEILGRDGRESARTGCHHAHASLEFFLGMRFLTLLLDTALRHWYIMYHKVHGFGTYL